MIPKIVRLLQQTIDNARIECVRGTCTIDVNVEAIQSGKLCAEIITTIDNDNVHDTSYLVFVEIVSANSLCMPVDTRWTICGAPQDYILPKRTQQSRAQSVQLNCGLAIYNTPSSQFCSLQARNFNEQHLHNVCVSNEETSEINVPVTYPYARLLKSVVCAQSCDWINIHMQQSGHCSGWSTYAPLTGSQYTVYDSRERIDRATTYIEHMRQSLVCATQTISCRPFARHDWNLPTNCPSFSATITYCVYFAHVSDN